MKRTFHKYEKIQGEFVHVFYCFYFAFSLNSHLGHTYYFSNECRVYKFQNVNMIKPVDRLQNINFLPVATNSLLYKRQKFVST